MIVTAMALESQYHIDSLLYGHASVSISHGGSGSRPSARVSPQDAPPRDSGGPSSPRRHEPRPGARPCRRPSPGLRTAGRRDVRSRAPCRAEAEPRCLSAAGRQGTATGHAVSPDGWRRLSDCGRCGRCPSHLANPVQAASGCPCPPAGLTRPVRASRSTGGPVGSGATVDRHGRSLVCWAAQGPEGPPWDRGEAVPRRPHAGVRQSPTRARRRVRMSVGAIFGRLFNDMPEQNGARGRNRTTDTMIFSHVLYQLSYLGLKVFSF